MVDLQKLVRDPFAAGQAAGASKMRPMVTLPVGLPAETCALDVEVDELDVLPPDVAEDVRAEEYCAICDPGLQEESADESDSDGIGVAEAGAPEADMQVSGASAVPEATPRPLRSAGDWQRVDVPGGYLMWSQARRAINAHCLCDGHGGARHCKWDRTVKAGDRPLGRQVAWLQLGTCDDACGTRQQHIDLKRDVGKAHYRAMRQAGRDRALHLAATCPDMAALMAFESPSGIDEAEPHVVRYNT